MVIVDFDSHSEKDSSDDCSQRVGKDVLNVVYRSASDHGPIEKEVSNEAKELEIESP